MVKRYFPYKSDKAGKKFYIINNEDKKIYFGATGYEHFTEGHLDERRKLAYFSRHRNDKINDPNSSGFWSFRYLWLYPSYDQAYKKIIPILKLYHLV
ncbi:hypothetical protein EBZ38_11950 [bacterium]|nr:hypothetical protein [bacterium]